MTQGFAKIYYKRSIKYSLESIASRSFLHMKPIALFKPEGFFLLFFIIFNFYSKFYSFSSEDDKNLKCCKNELNLKLEDFNTYISCRKKPLEVFTSKELTYTNTKEKEKALKKELKKEFKKNKISRKTSRILLKNLKYNEDVLKKQNKQPERKRNFNDYLNVLYKVRDQETLDKIKFFYLKNKNLIDDISIKQQIDKEILLTIFFFETKLGSFIGDHKIGDSLYSLSLIFNGTNRGKMFLNNLVYFARLIDKGVLKINSKGSWAGAFGLSQFMPENAVLFGKKYKEESKKPLDLYSLKDSLNSTAYFLKRMGWNFEIPAIFEVKIPSDFNLCYVGFNNSNTLLEWEKLGIQIINKDLFIKNNLSSETKFVLIAPDINDQDVVEKKFYLTTCNFKSILKYNKSTMYATSIGEMYNILKIELENKKES